ncbi:flagellar protein FliT [Enterobacter hormaechei]|uniref:flagellar protein FliT n=1 Tax=Enterobacter hormaechei TaxID=158836 RepID=UPI00188A8D31|nr:flagellar protein FliT [Enterobacter hormaechei]MBF4167763.1 flagellar protein FliT [Enterobacter hormaechei]
MDDIQVMRFLARSLEQAASQHDWPTMQDVDAQIAALLTALKGQTLSTEKREALAALQQVHARVSQFCQTQSDALEKQIARTRRNQEGATAYAHFASAEDLGL